MSTNGNAPAEDEQNHVAVVEEPLSAPTTEQLNMRCTGVKRLLKEAVELRQPNELFCAKPMEDNLFEWHFTMRGPPDTVYSAGVYHGRIVLPADYPMKPPNLILLTPNGRFDTNKKICLSISGYHPETWLPSWSIRTALLALVGFMPTHSAGALGGLECSQEERRRLAQKSLDWRCAQCGVTMRDALPPLETVGGNAAKLLEEVKSASAPIAAVAAVKKTTETTANEIAVTADGQQTQTPAESPIAVEQTATETANDTSPPVPQPSAQSPPRTVRFSTAIAATRNSRAQAFLGSPLLWMFILSALFLALLLRRVLINNIDHQHFHSI